MNVVAQPLTAAAFAPFGQAILPDPARAVAINAGTCLRHDALAQADIDSAGQVVVSLFHAEVRDLPLRLELFERHPLGSQAFIPLGSSTCCVVVAPGDHAPDLPAAQAFVVGPGQGCNIARGCWHHPLVALGGPGEFLVVDRAGPGANLEEFRIDARIVLEGGGERD